MANTLVTERLALRPWSIDDAEAALGAYGDTEVARWLAPAMDQINDLAAMRVVLQQWLAEDERMITPAGRWAIELRTSGLVIGGATLLPLQPDEEFEIGWQVIALVRPANERATAMVRRMGMEWVGETEKYHSLRLQEFRLRPGDLS
jgi:RimJ/RimL family protein N-acetyltransferase